ncbi:MAG TPA: glycosyltransferase family 4 protein [Candidatus Acidoferrales bacterium]|nr:glycosyltransferase family 4 protein [Candidatus Acidoferrales bacterium]
MRIFTLLVNVYDESHHGGTQVVAQETGRRLVERGHEVTFLARRPNRDIPLQENCDGVDVRRYDVDFRPAAIEASRKAAKRLWDEKPFDVLHTHFAYCAIGPSLAIPASVPRLRTFHGAWDQEADAGWGGPEAATIKRLKRGFRRWVEARDIRRSDAVVTLSEHSKRYVLERFNKAPASVHTVGGGVDFKRFVLVADKKSLRRKLRLPADGPLVMFAGRLVRPKGPFELLAAMQRFISIEPAAHLVIVGDGAERRALEETAAALGIDEHVHFAGYVHERMSEYYAAADVLVLASHIPETFGLVTAEALACGLPVIGAPLGATVDILKGLESRLLMKGTSADDIFEALQAFFSADWSRALGPDIVRAYALEHFSWERHAERVEQICQELIRKKR